MDYREAEAFDEKYGLANFVPTRDFKAMPQAEALTGFTGSLTWFIRKHKARWCDGAPSHPHRYLAKCPPCAPPSTTHQMTWQKY